MKISTGGLSTFGLKMSSVSASLGPKATTVRDVNPASARHLGHVEEHDAGHFVHEQDANHRDVEQQEQQHITGEIGGIGKGDAE